MYVFQQRTSHLLFIELEFYVNLDVVILREILYLITSHISYNQ